MQKRKLGHTGLEVPVITIGGNVYGWTLNEEESFRQLDAAVDAGLNFIDTADTYSRWVPGNVGGESETILGRWFARSGKRSQVILATKVGVDMGEGKKGLSSKYIFQEVEESLRRLQTDHIDLYQSHKDDESTPIEETLGAYQKLIEQGKVRFIGASNYSGKRLTEAMEISKSHNLPAYQTLQPHYNLVERKSYESDLAPVVKQYGLGVIPYFSLASGFLTGKYRSQEDLEGKARGSMAGRYMNERNLKILAVLIEVAQELNVPPARVALAWLIAQPGITSAIASATNDEQLQNLVKATELKLDQASLEKLNTISAV